MIAMILLTRISYSISLFALSFGFLILNHDLKAQEEDTNPKENQNKEKKVIKYNIGVKSSYTSSITGTEKNYIKKNIFEVLMQTNRFNIILGHQYKNTQKDNLYSLSIQITDAPVINESRKNDLNVKLILKDEVGNYLINYKEEKRVLRDKLQITVRKMIYGIFYGENYDPNLDKVINDEIIPLKKKLNDKNQGGDKPVGEEINLVEGDPKPLEDEEKPPVEEEEEEEEEKPKLPPPPKKENPKAVDISDFDSPDIDLSKDVPKEPKKIDLPLNWTNAFRMYVGSVDEEIVADSIVTVGTTTNRIVLGANGHIGVTDRNHFITYGGELGFVNGSHEFGFGPKYDFYGGYNVAPFGEFISVGPALSFSNLNYAAVFSAGDGERRFSGGGLWGGAKSEIFVDFGPFSVLLDFRYQRILVGTISNSGGDSVEASGTKVIMSGRVTFWENWGIGFRNESIEMTTLADSNLVVRDDSFGIFVTYQ
jgi:hypothetical protein